MAEWRAVHARGGDPNGDAWTCLRPHVPEPLIYTSDAFQGAFAPPGGDMRDDDDARDDVVRNGFEP